MTRTKKQIKAHIEFLIDSLLFQPACKALMEELIKQVAVYEKTPILMFKKWNPINNPVIATSTNDD